MPLAFLFDIFEISVIGGEPFYHKRILDILKYCEKREMAMNVVTNGTLLDEAIIGELSKINRLVVIVSLDGQKAIHDQIRGEGIFEKVISKIKDNSLKEKVKKQIRKIIEFPEIGKPMRYTRKGTREAYISPFRLSYIYDYTTKIVCVMDLYHKDEQ